MRGGAAAGAAAPAPRREPGEDPNFQSMKGKAGAAGTKAKAHQPAAAGAAAAQAAAVPPGNEVASQAAGAQVEEMGAQQPGTFDRKAFIAAVQKAIDAAAPKNLEEADDFKGSGKAAQVKDEVGALVKGGKKDAEKDIKQATDAPPDASKAQAQAGHAARPGGRRRGHLERRRRRGDARPAPAGGHRPLRRPGRGRPGDGARGRHRGAARQVQRAGLRRRARRPPGPPRSTARRRPREYRAQEQEELAKGRDEAEQIEGTQLAGMQGSKVAALAKVVGHKGEAKSQDEAKRAKVAADIQAIYDKTKTEVTGILTGLDGKVDSAFTSGEEAARKQFEDYVGAKMDAYKDDRYSGFFGGARWLKDKLFGMPDEVNVFYSQGRTGYLAAMDAVIGQVADIVGGELNAARLRIAQGRAEVRDYVTQLPTDLQKVGKDAEQKLDDQFDQLSSDVDNKQDALVDTLAQKYVQSRDALDSRIDELKAANRGLVAKALDAVVGVVKTILKLKDMLLNVLSKAADVIGDIITDPIGFLGRLVDGVKSGLTRFVDNIATHLQKGLMGWLFGALGDAGIQMPKTFDLAGIFELVMDVLGLTYRSIRGKVAKLLGEPIVEKMEQTVDVFKTLATKGVAGLWEWIKDKVGDFQEMVLGGIKTFIIERVIKGGITWLLSLLNPAAAFIKACKAIYDIVMFIVERGQAIMEFVNSILDSIGAIARGQIGIVADKVEGALAKALPLAISFLASLLGLGGITRQDPRGDRGGPQADREGGRLRRHGRREGLQEAVRRRDRLGEGQVREGQGLGRRTRRRPPRSGGGQGPRHQGPPHRQGRRGRGRGGDRGRGRGARRGQDRRGARGRKARPGASGRQGPARRGRRRGTHRLQAAGPARAARRPAEGGRPRGVRHPRAGDVQEGRRRAGLRQGRQGLLRSDGSRDRRRHDRGGRDRLRPVCVGQQGAALEARGEDEEPGLQGLDARRLRRQADLRRRDQGRQGRHQPQHDDDRGAPRGRDEGAVRPVEGRDREADGPRRGPDPRPFVSLATEDGICGGHSAERHILGQGDMPTHREVALRAAFWRVNGKLMKLDDAGIASVFATEGAATSAIQAALATLTPNWQAHMVTLAKGTQIKLTAPASVPAVAYEKHDSPKGTPYDENVEMPTYIDGSKPGRRELYKGDFKGDAKDPNAPDAAKDPLTTGGAAVQGNVYIIIDPSQDYPEGWAIYTAYPKP